jgi:hypothetical protein
MSLICKILGHKWDTSDRYEQSCTRKGCLTYRTLVANRFPKIGEPAIEWRIIDLFNIK